jgi:hypothetical protein
MVDVSRISQVILVIDGEEWVLKKKSSILNFCYDYLDYVDSSIRSEPRQSSKMVRESAPKKKPKGILKPESKPKKKSKPPPSDEEDEESGGSFDVGSSSEEPPKKSRSKKKKKELKPGYAKMNISYAETKGDIMKAAKEMARNVKFES